MPAFIKSEKDEKVWSRAKSLVHKQYPDISEDSDNFWKLTNSVYHKVRNSRGVNKAASDTDGYNAIASQNVAPVIGPIDHMRVSGYDIPAKTSYNGAWNWLNQLRESTLDQYKVNDGRLDHRDNFGPLLSAKSRWQLFRRSPHMCMPLASMFANHAFGGQPLTNKNTLNHRPAFTRELNVALNNNSDESNASLAKQQPLPINTTDFNWFRFSEDARQRMMPYLPAVFSLVDWNRDSSRNGHIGVVLPRDNRAIDWGKGRVMRNREFGVVQPPGEINPTYFQGTPGAQQFYKTVNDPNYPRPPHALSFAPFPASIPADRVAFDLYNETYVPRQTAARFRDLFAAGNPSESNKVPGYLLSTAGREARVKNLMGRFAEDYKNNASYVANLLKRPGEVYISDFLNPMKRWTGAFNYAAKFNKFNRGRVPGAAYVLPPLD